MNKKFSRLLSIALVLVLCMALAPTAFAFTYAEIPGTTATFDKYLVLDTTANVPDVTFTFTIKPGQAVAAGDGTFEILPGPVEGSAPTYTAPTVGNAAFTYAGDNNSKSTTTTGKSVSLGADQSFVSKQVSVNLTGVKFKEPGVYRYELEEVATPAVPGITYHTGSFYLDVYVTDNEGVLQISDYRFINTNANITSNDQNGTKSGEAPDDGYPANTKITGITNTYSTYDLIVKKLVSGNQASRDKYFKFNLKITGAAPGTYQVVSNPGSNTTNSATNSSYTDLTNPTTITIGTDGTNGDAGTDFYLQHNQTITILDLSSGAKYTITEVPEDYNVKSIAAEGDEDVATTVGTATCADTGTGITADTTVTFTNERAGAVPTGVLLTIAPFAALMVVGLAGVTVMLRKKRED